MSSFREWCLAFCENIMSLAVVVNDFSMLWLSSCCDDSGNIIDVWIFDALPHHIWSWCCSWFFLMLNGFLCMYTNSLFLLHFLLEILCKVLQFILTICTYTYDFLSHALLPHSLFYLLFNLDLSLSNIQLSWYWVMQI